MPKVPQIPQPTQDTTLDFLAMTIVATGVNIVASGETGIGLIIAAIGLLTVASKYLNRPRA